MLLTLSDGTSYTGRGFGYEKSISGELIFNTGMVGYPETLTDPSYAGQIIIFTYPLIGNYGIPSEEAVVDGLRSHFESGKIQPRAIVICTLSDEVFHWKGFQSLDQWLKKNKVPGICEVDTRTLTQHIREKGSMLAKLTLVREDVDFYDPNMESLVPSVSIDKVTEYGSGPKTVILVDCGAKQNILRSLLKRNLKVIRVPWNYDYSDMKFDGIFLSNGPGDPMQVPETVEVLRKQLDRNKPIFGICLGNQMLSLAAGASTYKLKFGHRSQNQPCIQVGTKRCLITSQNHGFAVDDKTLPDDWTPWFFNANDGTNEGIRHRTKPFMSVQFHPEAFPGPTDAGYLFDEFTKLL